jgi:hypothetical protein
MFSGMAGEWLRTWAAYARQRSGGDDAKKVHERTDISASTVRKWLRYHRTGASYPQPSTETIDLFVQAYDPGNLDDALLAAGRVSANAVDVKPVRIEISLQEVSDADFLQELADRLPRFRRLLDVGNDSEEGLASDDFIEDLGVDGTKNRDQG